MAASYNSNLARSVQLTGALSTTLRNSRNILTASSFASRREDDSDEDALMWAALEKLPTYDRITKAILVGEGTAEDGVSSDQQVVDVRRLGQQQRHVLLQRLIRYVDEDNLKFLERLKNRIDRVGIDLPTVKVRYENLGVEVETYQGNRALPTLYNSLRNMLEGILTYLHMMTKQTKKMAVLHNLSGLIKPQRMTLLLGPPGSGKTTLLLALAGRIGSEMKISGRVTYNGIEMHEFIPQRTAAYIGQHDLHIGEMTVRETLAFSARCQGVGSRYEMLMELCRREKAANIKPDTDVDVFMKAISVEGQEVDVVTDYILKILGLDICADTMVGDAMLRGISGGQKKRVTTGEMLVGPAIAFFMDEISTGLDSSTTFQIVKSIKESIHVLGSTAVISLLQPAPETYNLFDDLILLSDGHIVYQGPVETVLEFFGSMGFKCPERKGVADFLQEVTSKKDQQQYWVLGNNSYNFVPSKEFAEKFQSFHIGRKLSGELASPSDKSKFHTAALTTLKYGSSKKQLLIACIMRELLLMKRNTFAYIFRATQLSILCLLGMAVFFRTEMHRDSLSDGMDFMGAMFFSICMILYNGFSEVAMTVWKLDIFYKQRDLLFYPTWAYALPSWLLKIPITLLEVSIWVFLSYYVIGYDPNVGSVTLLLLFMVGGFNIIRGDIKRWWKWGYWSSPVMYAMNAITTNEFLGHSWSHTISGTKERLGVAVLKFRDIFPEKKWYWIGVGAMFGYTVLFNILFTAGLAYLSHGHVVRQNKGSILPFVPLSITFDDIKYSVDMPQEMKSYGASEDRLMLLKGVSGAFRPGVLTALMGSSGAGKTTLLDVLAGRKTGGYIEGSICVSGYPKRQESFARVAAYCEQNDIHSPQVTVHESLVFSAWLRLPDNVDTSQRKMFVEEIMELVELKSLSESIVGMPGKNGLSTEQCKRLTIAVELVANPSIIFMDEPTSGLDARAAAIVMRTVRNTVNTGRTIVCTIHQPSIDIFEAFDELFLMKRGGEEIYVGPLGHHSCNLINYFEAIDGVRKIRDGYNPATWMLEVTSLAQEETLGVNFAEVYKNSELYQRNKSTIQELSTPLPDSNDINFPTRYAKPFIVQCVACLWKQQLSYWRNPSYNVTRLLLTILVALIVGSVFWDLGTKVDNQNDLSNAMGSMFLACMILGVQNASSVQPIVAIERTVLYRERSAGMYSALSYAFGQVAVELPYIFAQSILFNVITYSMIHYEWTAVKFFWYIYFMTFTFVYFTFYGMMTVGLTPSYNVAAILSTIFYCVWILFSGFLIPRPRIPPWCRWYFWLNPLAWTLYGLIVSQYGDLEDKLDTGESVSEFLRHYYGYKHCFVGVTAAMMIVFTVLFIAVFASSIKWLNFQRR